MQQTWLFASNAHQTPLAEFGSAALNRVAHTPYGIHSAGGPLATRMGFNGQLREPSGWYSLGNGHRVYNPVLRRFHSPDRLSPFGKGGLNAYAYCQGDPLNYTDPSGQFIQWLTGNPAHVVGLNAGLFLLNLAALFTAALTPVGVIASVIGMAGAVVGATGSAMQLGGKEAGKYVSVVGTLISSVGTVLKVGVMASAIYKNPTAALVKAKTNFKQFLPKKPGTASAGSAEPRVRPSITENSQSLAMREVRGGSPASRS